MVRYFYDCEFIESGYGNPLDLISIGMVCEDGRELYYINENCDWNRANNWVRENVLKPIGIEQINSKCYFSSDAEKHMVPRERIPRKILQFVKHDLGDAGGFIDDDHIYQRLHQAEVNEKIELWAYYADYDHVILSQLFGTMMDLPKGFPMYTKDLKQECDRLGNPKLPEQSSCEHHALEDAKHNRVVWEFLNGFAISCQFVLTGFS